MHAAVLIWNVYIHPNSIKKKIYIMSALWEHKCIILELTETSNSRPTTPLALSFSDIIDTKVGYITISKSLGNFDKCLMIIDDCSDVIRCWKKK